MESIFKPRDYQVRIANEANDILKRKGFVYLSMQVRTGKTITALQTCKNYGAKKVLFITKLKAFSSIQYDMQTFGFKFELQIINKESIHKIIDNDFGVIICDEAHGLFGTYPKINKFTKEYRKRFFETPCILLSGTMSPESYSQLFHQFWINKYAPFSKYTNFYKWANDYVNVKQKQLGYAKVNDYSDARKKDFWHLIRYYILTFSQQEAGFTTNVNEMVLEVEMQPITYKLIDKLCKDLVITSTKTGKTILADTAVKLQQKVHQLSSGTIKFEDGTTQIIDNSKALFIKEKFKDNKIAIFYNFVAELDMLKKTFGNKLTTDLEEFNTTDKWFAGQIVSSREGISLAKADALVMFNIQFSAVSYFQSRDRLTTKDRKENNVFWVFSKNGLEHKIYQRVMKKLDYTSSNFKKDYNVRTNYTKENYNTTRKARLLRS